VEHWLFGSGISLGWLVRSHGVARHRGTERRTWGMHGPSTLLGPEGTAALRPKPQQDRLSSAHKAVGDRDRPYLENCTVDASIICSCQVNKGTRWMPWHQEPMKDVGACDKPRGVGNQTSIRGFPNRET
jgi:hypothetical protein